MPPLCPRPERSARTALARTLALTLLPVALFACGTSTGPEPDPEPVASVQVTPDSATIIARETRAFSASTLATGGAPLTGRTIAWSVANSTVATVDANGTVTGVSEGSTTVRATSEGVVGSATVDVLPVPVAEVVVSPDSVTLEEGDTLSLDAEARDASGGVLPGREVRWSSADPSVARVDSLTGTVTAVGAGSTSIIATVEAVSDTASVVVTAGPALSGVTRVWRTDGPDDSWSNASNWTPNGVPTATDTVLVSPGGNVPTLDADQSVSGLTVEAGASINLDGNELTVVRDAEVEGDVCTGGGTIVAVSGGTLSGQMPGLRVTGPYTLSGPLSVCGDMAVSGTGRLDVGTGTVTVGGDFSTANVGVLMMQEAVALVDVEGEARFRGGDSNGLMTAGTLRVGGDFLQFNVGTFASFSATEDHVVVLDGGGAQTLTLSLSEAGSNRSHFAHLEIAGLAVDVTHTAVVEGALQITSATTVTGIGSLSVLGDVTTSAGSDLRPARVDIGGTLDVTGSFSPENTYFTGVDQGIPAGLDYDRLWITGTAALTGPTEVDGSLRITDGGRLTIGPHSVTVADIFRTEDDGTLVMQDAAGVLEVDGDARFSGASTNGLLTNGTLLLRADLDQFSLVGNRASFSATENHRTVLAGSVIQSMVFGSAGTGATESHFAHLEIAGQAVDFPLTTYAEGDVDVSAPTTVTGGGTLQILGDLTTAAGSSVTTFRVDIGDSMAISGSFSPFTTYFTGVGQSIQAGLGYRSVWVTGTASMTGTTVLTGDLRVDTGSLTIGPNDVAVGGDFRTSSLGVLVMMDASGELDIEGETFFSGGSTQGLLTAGTIRAARDVLQSLDGSTEALAATDDHVFIMDGSLPQNVIMTSSDLEVDRSHFAHFEVAPGSTATFNNRVGAEGSMTLNGTVTITNFAVRIGLDLTLGAGATIVNNGSFEVGGTCTDNGATVTGTGTGNAACIIP
ncbi:MAG: Ig-like domain-containing protein [Gemmatimonadota bacterium]